MSRSEFNGEQVVESADFVFFWKPPAVFSQWTASAFTVEGIRYVNAEQYMMAEKARLFADEETRRKILATASPRTQKRLGRQVSGFEGATWLAWRERIVFAGNLAKFSQNQAMLEVLLATGDKILVEASPYYRIWGIGLRADDTRVHDPAQWRGENLLGKALLEVRRRLRSRD